MDVLFASALVVALAEIGDKTMLLAVALAARFRKPWPIIAGILLATLANHAVAAWAGTMVAGLLDGTAFRIAVGVGFLAMAAWAMIPDKLDDASEGGNRRFGAFLTTLVAFFIVEIGDKTQIATIGLGARYQSVALVTFGTTAGMLLANVPAVLLGDRITRIVPMKWVRLGAAASFAILGLWTVAVAVS